MQSFYTNSSFLLVFSELLIDVGSIKKYIERQKESMEFMSAPDISNSQVLIVQPHFPSYSLFVNSVSSLSNFYETQAKELAKILHKEFGFSYEQIHIESGALERLIKKYIAQYQIDIVISDLEFFKENEFLKTSRKKYFEKSMDSLISLYGD